MSYLTQSKMAQDYGLIMRIAACAASEGVAERQASWADDRRKTFMATPGWATEYAAAQARRDGWDADSELPQPYPPGEDEDAITDDMIAAAVRAVIAAELAAAAPPEPDPAE